MNLIINKAIEEGDLIFLDGDLVKPNTFDGEQLTYLNLVTQEDMIVHIDCVDKVVSYEDGVN